MTVDPPTGGDRPRTRRASPTPRRAAPERRSDARGGRPPASESAAGAAARRRSEREPGERSRLAADAARTWGHDSADSAAEIWDRVSERFHTRFVARRAHHRARGAPGYSERNRYHALVGVVALLSVLVTVKLVNIQVISPDRYLNLGTNQRVKMDDLPGPRGTIRDRNGVDLALSVQMVTLIADPKRVTDPGKATDIIAGEVDVDADELAARLGDSNSRFTYVARQIDPRTGEAVLKKLQKAGIAGFFIEDDQQRVNPAESLASAVVGRTDIDGAGTSGIEKTLDDQLTGTPGERIVERAPDGSGIANAPHKAVPAIPGEDVTLTLDQTLQYEAERQLVAAVDSESANAGVAIMGDPRTGELLAVANVARNQDTGEVSPVIYNMAFAAAFEAGSVMKVVTVAGAYEDNKTDPNEQIMVPASLKVGDHDYTDSHWHPTEPWRVQQIVAQSSNIGTITLGQRVGAKRLEELLRSFGFGARTELDLPGESRGLLSSSDDWYPTDLASISIGQGIAVTPVQLWSAYNVIANEGLYVPPRLIEEVGGPDGTAKPVPAGEERRVIRPEVARWMNLALQQVVLDGTASEWSLPGYTVAAKTGTARKPNPDTGRYDWGGGSYRYNTVFSGFLPASDPQLSITVLLDEPKNHLSGASAAGPVFNELAKAGLTHLQIPPDRPSVPRAESGDDEGDGPVRATPAPPAPPRTTPEDERAAAEGSGGAGGAGDRAVDGDGEVSVDDDQLAEGTPDG